MSKWLFGLGGLAVGVALGISIAAIVDSPQREAARLAETLAAAEKERDALRESLAMKTRTVSDPAPQGPHTEPDWSAVRRGTIKQFWLLGREWRYAGKARSGIWPAEAFGCSDPEARVLIVFDNEGALLEWKRQQQFVPDGPWLDHGPARWQGEHGEHRLRFFDFGHECGFVALFRADGSIDEENSTLPKSLDFKAGLSISNGFFASGELMYRSWHGDLDQGRDGSLFYREWNKDGEIVKEWGTRPIVNPRSGELLR